MICNAAQDTVSFAVDICGIWRYNKGNTAKGGFFMMLRKITGFLLCLMLVIGLAVLFAVPTYAADIQTLTVDPINITVGGKEFLPTDANGENVPVFAYNGTTYAPLRALAEAYGLSVG